MTLRFRTLLTLRVTHAYYDGPCRDFRFVVPEGTAAALRNGKVLARELDGTLYLLFQADEAGNPLARLDGTTLRFGMRLANAAFGNVTVLPAGFPQRRLYYANTAAPGTLQPGDGVRWVGGAFTHVLSGTARPATVTLRDAEGATVAAETLAADDGRTSVSFDLRARGAGRFEVEEALPGGTTVVPCYHDGELQAQDAVGVAEVEIDGGFYAAPPAFVIPFDAREEVLRYYVVARNYSDAELGQLAVSDAGFAEDGRTEIGFVRVAPAAFTPAEVDPALVAAGGERVVLFRSAGPLARRERGRRRIQLSRNGEVLIANLPQPGADRARADLIIHVSKP